MQTMKAQREGVRGRSPTTPQRSEDKLAQSLAKNFIDLALAKPQKFFIQILRHLCLL